MPHRRRKQPIQTAAICLHMPQALRLVVENYADSNRLSLCEAGRDLLAAGAKALGIDEVA